MLVLTRKINESIVIPNSGVTITVLATSKSRVRLGISAPPHIPIHRDEVHRRISQSHVDFTDFNREQISESSNH